MVTSDDEKKTTESSSASDREKSKKNDMVTEVENNEKYLEWLPPLYGNKLKCIRESVSRLCRDCQTTYPQLAGFTPHGPEHSRSVEDLIHQLIPGYTYKTLNVRERFYLLVSAWVHDIGMLRGINGESDRKESDDEIRNQHHIRSEIFIVNNFSRLDIEQEDAQTLGLLSYFHRRRANLDKCPEDFAVGTEIIQLRLLAAYLRLADSLDIGQTRSPSLNYAICLAYNIPMSSKLHWIKSRLISGVDISPINHRIIIDFKTPRDSDFYFHSRDGRNDRDTEIQQQNLSRLRKAVLDDLRNELDFVKTVMIRAGISYFLDIDERKSQMVIDNQVLPEIVRLVNNFEMMTHPSSTKLICIVLQTLLDILEPNQNNIKNVWHCKGTCDDGDHDQTLDRLTQDVHEFIREIECQILRNRPCHLGLKKLVDKLKGLVSTKSLRELLDYVKQEFENINKVRSNVRLTAERYLIVPKPSNNEGHVEKLLAVNNPELDFVEGEYIYDEKFEKLFKGKECINILVYGYSELVIKALCGFRDTVIRKVVREFSKKPVGDLRLHKVDLEKKASSKFRIFVCEGQPKTITAQNDALVYHDGTRYALALSRRGFINVVIIPDLVAGTLLGGYGDSGAKIDFVMLGTNGLQLGSNKPRFLHSSGHLAVATLARFYQNSIQDESSNSTGSTQSKHHGDQGKPKIILVLSASKCSEGDEACKEEKREEEAQESSQSPGCLNNKGHKEMQPCIKGEIVIKEGYRFWKSYSNEAIRLQAFLARDEKIREELEEFEISFYTPREDSVELNMVDDIIADGKFFRDIDKGSNIEELKKWVTERQREISGVERKPEG